MFIAGIIFAACIVLFIIDKFKPATVALAGCAAMVVCGVLTPAEAFSGFTNDIIFIVFGTEIFGIAFLESGLAHIVASFIVKKSGGNEKRVIIIAGIIAAALSAFLNNQVVCSLMMVICVSIAETVKKIDIKNITLPVIFASIFGGQTTLIGAPATILASSVAKENSQISISMFDMLPMGSIVFAVGMLFIIFILYGKGKKIWGNPPFSRTEDIGDSSYKNPDKRKMIITLIAGMVMLICFIGGFISVGMASLLGGIICLFGAVKPQKELFAKIDWNILIWLGCSIGLTEGFVKSGAVEKSGKLCMNFAGGMTPFVFLTVFVVITFVVSNLIANTTTVMMILPFALNFAAAADLNPKTFLIAITMSAGLSIMTPLSSGFIGMTLRVGYKFSDYIRYAWGLQVVLCVITVLLSCVFFPL